MYDIPNEDAYWEAVRERLENPPRRPWDEPPEPEQDYLWLDDLADEIEQEYGCDISELYEADLMDIVEKNTGIEPISAEYDPDMFGICYRYREAA